MFQVLTPTQSSTSNSFEVLPHTLLISAVFQFGFAKVCLFVLVQPLAPSHCHPPGANDRGRAEVTVARRAPTVKSRFWKGPSMIWPRAVASATKCRSMHIGCSG